MDLPCHDNHFHCKPDGWLGLEAVRKFMAAGGTSIAHVRLPTYPASVEAFAQTCRDHLAFSDTIRKEGLTVWSAIGPYPLEIMKVAEAQGWDRALEYGRGCYDAAGAMLANGDGHCLGEVGRAHFEVDVAVQDHLNELLEHGMAVAADADVPIMLHTEHTEAATMAEFAGMADRAGLRRDRVIKHYCGPLVAEGEHHGLIPSVIAGRSNIRKALAKDPSGRFMLETDYIDEPTRPNVVMPPDTVPKRTFGLHANGELSEEQIESIHAKLPRALYGDP